jgi:hypothetical protein
MGGARDGTAGWLVWVIWGGIRLGRVALDGREGTACNLRFNNQRRAWVRISGASGHTLTQRVLLALSNFALARPPVAFAAHRLNWHRRLLHRLFSGASLDMEPAAMAAMQHHGADALSGLTTDPDHFWDGLMAMSPQDMAGERWAVAPAGAEVRNGLLLTADKNGAIDGDGERNRPPGAGSRCRPSSRMPTHGHD